MNFFLSVVYTQAVEASTKPQNQVAESLNANILNSATSVAWSRQSASDAVSSADTSSSSNQQINSIAAAASGLTEEIEPTSGFVPCSGRSCSACHFIALANTAIKWLITISFLFFAVLAVRAGIKLVISQGNAGALSNAKESFTNAFIGLIIILCAFLLVDTIMRQLVRNQGTIEGYGPWNEVRCTEQVAVGLNDNYYPGDPEFDPPPVPPGVTIAGSSGCSGGSCVPLTIPCSAKGCSIAPDMVARLEAMHKQAGVAGARVTEAMPPSRAHKSSCHSDGTCIDYSKAGGMTPTEIKKVINAAYANGLRPVYEVKTQSQKDGLVAAGAPADSIKVLGNWISAPHFSIYGR